jgi:Protein of Unknown function (DUF2784)
MNPTIYTSLADLVLFLHIAIVLFVVGGLLLVVVGNVAAWQWVNGRLFRYAHLAAIAVVVVQSWLGVTCPLTTLESWLREQAGASAYATGFIQYWVQHLLFYQAPEWVFTLVYTGFGLLVAATWWFFPPKGGRPKPIRGTTSL